MAAVQPASVIPTPARQPTLRADAPLPASGKTETVFFQSLQLHLHQQIASALAALSPDKLPAVLDQYERIIAGLRAENTQLKADKALLDQQLKDANAELEKLRNPPRAEWNDSLLSP